MILSNSPIFIVEKIAKRFGVSEFSATTYRLSPHGQMLAIETLFDGEKKREYVKEHRENRTITAYSDSILDLPFLEEAEVQVAVRPDRKLLKRAKALGWEIL